jgi:CBS domain-containing protein
MNISKLMHRNAITCTTHDMLDRAAQLMWDHDIGCLPVVSDDGKVAGMITDRDICMAAYTQGTPLRAIPVTTPMAKQVHACAPDDDVHEVEQAMQRWQVRRMPVIDDNGHPVGVISLNDLARASQKDGIPAREVAATLAAVCAPRPLVVASA